MEYTIWITNDCNMKCRYCYVDKMKGTNSFAENSVARLIQFINETSKTVKEIKINFFGGEPLLKFDLIQFIIEKMEKELVVDVKYFLTTNGLLLNESIIEYFKEKK